MAVLLTRRAPASIGDYRQFANSNLKLWASSYAS